MLRLDDEQLIEVLKTLTPAQRRIIRDHLDGRETAVSRLILREIRRRLKAEARRRKEARHKHAGLSMSDARFFDLLN